MSEFPKLKFRVSAPGKVILHGEHSVVYGKSALAGVIGARNTIRIEENDSDIVLFNFESFTFAFEIKVDDLNNLLEVVSKRNNLEHIDLLEISSNFVENLVEKDILSNKAKKYAFISFLYLFIGIFLENNTKILRNAFQGVLSSELKIGAGLGSSASFGVCLSAVFLILSTRKSINSNLTEADKEFISKWAFNSEKIMHGQPSGVDNTICTFGNIVKFSKGQKPQQIIPKNTINILLVNSNVERNTIDQVSKVAALKAEFPNLVDHIFCGMDEIVTEATKLYETVSSSDEDFNKLEKLFQINNDLLKSIGVSHPKLEKIFSYATKFGFSSKLTGAGGGGYVIILLKTDFNFMREFRLLCNELELYNYTFTETTIGGDGLRLLWF